MEAIEILKKVDFFYSPILKESMATITKYLKFPTYKEVKIPKPNGKTRILSIPDEPLMEIQKIILKNFLYELPVSPFAHCAIKKRSVVTNIQPHINSRSFFKIDFKDAFPSVYRQMVIQHLTPLIEKRFSHLSSQEAKDLACLIGALTTYRNSLPQGAPTSPYLLNLVCYQLDQTLQEIVEKFKLNYTRYADDLWFSSPENRIPKEARSEIVKRIQEYGFKLNREKISYKTGCATVAKITGITLVPRKEGSKKSIPIKTIEEYRSRIHQGIANHNIDPSEITGIIGWVVMATGKIPERLQKPFSEFLQKRCPEKMSGYAHFLNQI